MTNPEETQPASLASLRRALATLQNYDLPPEGKAAVQQALRSVAELSQTLGGKVEQQDRLSALYQVSQILGTSLQLDEVLNQVMDAVIGLTGAERGMLMMVEAETGELRVRAARNVAQGQLEQDDMTFSRTVIQTVMETGEGVVTTNAQEDPRFAGEESVIAFGLRSILCAPLRARSKTIGAIYVDNRARAGLFTPEDLDLLNAFAAQAAAAIDNANLFTQTDQSLAARVAELEELARIVRKLNTSLDIQEVARIATQWAMAAPLSLKSSSATTQRKPSRQPMSLWPGPCKPARRTYSRLTMANPGGWSPRCWPITRPSAFSRLKRGVRFRSNRCNS
jgi:hypothetical protein